MSKIHELGPAVLGQEEYERRQAELKGGGLTFGPAVTGYEKKEEKPPEPSPAHLSMRDLETVMDADPRKMDYYLSAEWDREGGPRKSALRLFMRLEAAKDDPRQTLLDRITEALAE